MGWESLSGEHSHTLPPFSGVCTEGRGKEKGKRRKKGRGRREEVEKGGEGKREVKHMVLVRISSSPYLAGSTQDQVGAVHCPPYGLYDISMTMLSCLETLLHCMYLS